MVSTTPAFYLSHRCALHLCTSFLESELQINFELVDTKSGVTLFDTSSRKPIAFVYGSPLLELENEIGSSALKMIKLGLDGMRAGGKRTITGFDLVLNLDLLRVSIAPS